MEQEAKAFFLYYERAISTADVSAIGNLYADTFMFGGPKGVQAVKREDFLKVVPRMKAHFASLGLTETRLAGVEASAISSKFLQVKATWRMTVRNSTGSKRIDTLATYVLERKHGEGLSIVFQIDHQDLAATIQEQ